MKCAKQGCGGMMVFASENSYEGYTEFLKCINCGKVIFPPRKMPPPPDDPINFIGSMRAIMGYSRQHFTRVTKTMEFYFEVNEFGGKMTFPGSLRELKRMVDQETHTNNQRKSSNKNLLKGRRPIF